ncbi:MAG: HAMP domain-containing protein, partial [Solirubrobacteraceae bacterium]
MPPLPASTSGPARSDEVLGARAAAGTDRILGRLGIRGRLFGLALALALLGGVCVTFATTGLVSQKGKVQSVDTTFKNFRTERNAYEGWLTADDQMNMYAALAILNDPHQHALANTTWGQVVQGHAQALSALNWLVTSADTPAVRNAARSTLTDLNSYYSYTMQMHQAALAGQPQKAVRLVTVSNAPASNKTQADFNNMGQVLTTQAAEINSQARSAASSSISLVIIVAVISVLLAIAITVLLARSIIRPLDEITGAAEQLAEGDLDVSVPPEGEDEIGRLAGAFQRSAAYLGEMAGAAGRVADGDLTVRVNPRSERDVLGQAFARMRTTLAATIENIARSSDSVGSASSEMAQSSQQAGMAVGEIANAVGSVAAGAETQVRSLEQARTVTAQVAAASQASAAEADETATVARQARDVAEQGAEAVRRASEAMRAVHESSSEITERMR